MSVPSARLTKHATEEVRMENDHRVPEGPLEHLLISDPLGGERTCPSAGSNSVRVRELLIANGYGHVADFYSSRMAGLPEGTIGAPIGLLCEVSRSYIDELSSAVENLRKSTNAAQARLREKSNCIRNAKTRVERRAAVRDFLTALAELLLCLLRFLIHAMRILLSRLVGSSAMPPKPLWVPEPIEVSPQITPRGPNSAFPVMPYRGGHHRSALGSAVLAA
jgi:hypothetical protein